MYASPERSREVCGFHGRSVDARLERRVVSDLRGAGRLSVGS
jgi:hypothetical protein